MNEMRSGWYVAIKTMLNIMKAIYQSHHISFISIDLLNDIIKNIDWMSHLFYWILFLCVLIYYLISNLSPTFTFSGDHPSSGIIPNDARSSGSHCPGGPPLSVGEYFILVLCYSIIVFYYMGTQSIIRFFVGSTPLPPPTWIVKHY